MSFNTTPITVDEACQLVRDSDGEVVSASKEEYFNNREWMKYTVKAEISDDSVTLIFRLHNDDFVVYCCVRSEDMTT